MDFNNLVDLMFIYGLSETENAKASLILRYRNKVSERLLTELKALKEKGDRNFTGLMKQQLESPSLLLNMIPKDEAWQGASISIPLIKETK